MIFKRLGVERWDRSRRRKLVVVLYLSLATAVVSQTAGMVLGEAVGEWVWALAIPAFLFCMPLHLATFVTLRFSIQNLAYERKEKLDERQRSVRYRANYRSYQILTWTLNVALFIALVYTVAVQIYPRLLWLPEGTTIFYGVMVVGWLNITLPMAVAAWTEPDPEAEGEI